MPLVFIEVAAIGWRHSRQDEDETFAAADASGAPDGGKGNVCVEAH
jgi:hypothetical protein